MLSVIFFLTPVFFFINFIFAPSDFITSKKCSKEIANDHLSLTYYQVSKFDKDDTSTAKWMPAHITLI